MKHPRLDTPRGIKRQRYNIEHSKAKLDALRKAPVLGGTNFGFVCWGDATEIKLWQRRNGQ